MSDNYKVEIGKRLKLQRNKFKFTQEQMAEKLNISVKHYSEVERGITGLSIENLVRACKILGLSLDYTVNGVSDEDNIPVELRELYAACPDDKKEALIRLMEDLRNLVNY
ncbi:helix-turn-helix domain-containing protein [Konateibacter massiliensis]|uniref:helix-turn-helix domain-containing protein n=1 Tax=Konateibacter massiliensis TaxID=2002841 RepID=UPI0015D4E4E2|nr:helix-turn-helix transcriptional regulator [Konateibacter massiliensis]